MKRIILFDKDGTLLNYQKIWTPYAKKAINAFAEAFDRHEAEAEIAHDLGLIDGEIAPNSILASGTGTMIQQRFEDYEEGGAQWMKGYYEKNLDDLWHNMELIEGSKAVLERLVEDGYKSVLVTSDSHQSAMSFIRKFSLDPLLHDVITGDDSPYPKPDVRMLEPFKKRHGYQLEDLVMVGDNQSDTMLGYEEGLFTVGVLSGTSREMDLEGADIIIDSVVDLYEGDSLIIEGK